MLTLHVEWDTTTDEHPDGDPSVELPATVEVPMGLDPCDVADWLSDRYGWLVKELEYRG